MNIEQKLEDYIQKGDFSLSSLGQLTEIVDEILGQFPNDKGFARAMDLLLAAFQKNDHHNVLFLLINTILPYARKCRTRESLTNQIKEQYSSYMYPDFWKGKIPPGVRKAAKNLTAFYNLDYIQHVCFPELISDLSVLNAGCGTGEALVLCALAYPNVSFTAIDISQNSLKRAKEYAKRLGLRNIKFIHGNLMNIKLGESFDIIHSSGVIHHLENPSQGLTNLKNHLKPHGVIALFVYGEYGRFEISLMQEAVKILNPAKDFGHGIEVVEKILKAAPSELKITKLAFRSDLALGNQHIVDLLVNANEHRYTVNTLQSLAQTAGLRIHSFIGPSTYDPETYIKLDQKPLFAKDVKYLSIIENAALAELLNGSLSKHHLFLTHEDNITLMPTIYDKGAISYKIFKSPYILEEKDGDTYKLCLNPELLLESIPYSYQGNVVVLDELAHKVFQDINGQTIETLFKDYSNVNKDDFVQLLKQLYDNNLIYLHI